MSNLIKTLEMFIDSPLQDNVLTASKNPVCDQNDYMAQYLICMGTECRHCIFKPVHSRTESQYKAITAIKHAGIKNG